MSFSAKLALKQSQSLVMTPQLQQAIKLLQLSNVELARYLEQELERNPLLERGEGDGENPISYTAGGIVAPAGNNEVAAPNITDAVNAAATADTPVPEAGAGDTTASIDDTSFGSEALETMGESWHNADSSDVEVGSSVAFENWGSGGGSGSSSGGGFDDDYDFEANLVSEISLRDHIESQINIEFEDAGDRAIALQVFESLDEAGYLSGDMNRLAATVGCRLSRVEGVVGRLQKFDPPGIFARGLVECLQIQLEDLGEWDLSFQIIVENLDLVAAGDWAKLLRMARITEPDLRERIGVLKSLQPKPVLAYDTQSAQVITPDVILRTAPAGGWIVELNAQNLPRVLVNNAYAARIQNSPLTGRDKEFMIEQTQSANWLVKALQQRATTILKVSTAIVQTQEEFFSRGVQYLRPLVLRDIAERVGIHESTVSRVTNNKFIQTPRGVYELKYFFTASIAASDVDGAAHSAEAVRHRIKVLIDGESKEKILSDDTIVKVLREDGIDIARRTVAKYREAMRIPSSVQRRRQKSMM